MSKATFNQSVLIFPQNIKKLTKEECAMILHKALAASEKFKFQSEVAKATGINGKSMGDYFTARYKVPQKNWDVLREVLFEDNIKVSSASDMGGKKITEAKHSAERLKAISFLLKDELEYFKDSSTEAREILKEYLSGSEVGYIASLLTALYDEDQLDIWKSFSK